MHDFRSLVAESLRPARTRWRAIRRARRTTRSFPHGDRLHFGCGSRIINGWINIDLDVPGAVDWDLRQPVPVADGSIRFIYSEHFFEHITREEGLAHLADCYRVLRPDGVLRMSTPNLHHLVDLYLAGAIGGWKEQDWSPKTPTQFLNEALRLWGHQFVYDAAELQASFAAVGFRSHPVEWGRSDYAELCGLETRPYHHDLIVEAVKM